MELSRARTIRIAVSVAAALIVGCAAALWAVAALRPPTIRTSGDQVAYALRAQGVRYERITFGEIWPDHVNRQYGEQAGPISIAVYVTLNNGGSVDGWMECRRMDEDCTLSIADLGLRRAPLPALSKQQAWPWLEWAERALATVWN